MTIPTIGELKGNTILELFNNGYDAIKDGKQDKLVAGDNIVINGNTISAIQGGTPVLENYYTKDEVNNILDESYYAKIVIDDEFDRVEQEIEDVANEIPDMTQYYTKAQVDALIPAVSGIEVINPTLYSGTNGLFFTNELKHGDIVVVELRSSNDTAKGSFVLSYTDNNVNNAITINPTFSLTPDANNYIESYDIASLTYDSVNLSYNIRCIKVTKTITNGLSSLAYSAQSISNINSKVSIYRKTEE